MGGVASCDVGAAESRPAITKGVEDEVPLALSTIRAASGTSSCAAKRVVGDTEADLPDDNTPSGCS